eukprot:1349133-Heterocapsa_arctica.AAC.1
MGCGRVGHSLVQAHADQAFRNDVRVVGLDGNLELRQDQLELPFPVQELRCARLLGLDEHLDAGCRTQGAAPHVFVITARAEAAEFHSVTEPCRHASL